MIMVSFLCLGNVDMNFNDKGSLAPKVLCLDSAQSAFITLVPKVPSQHDLAPLEL